MADTAGFLTVPPGVLRYTPPSDYVLEKDKTPKWFTEYLRWIISIGYDQKQPTFSNGAVSTMGMAQEAIENWSYIFAKQTNKTFAFTETDFQGNTIPAVWIPGSKVAELFAQIQGRMLADISNLEISAKNLSRDVSSKRSEMLEKLILKNKLDSILKQAMPDGIDFNPMGGEDGVDKLQSIDDIEKYVTKWKDKYTILVERMAGKIMEFDFLKDKFISSCDNQIAGGLSSMLTQTYNGRPINEPIQSWKVIWDNRQDDDYNKDAWFCGVMESHVPYQKIIQQFGKDFTEDEIKEIRALADPNNMEQAGVWASYYNNTSLGGSLMWVNNWGTASMCLSYARVWFIAPRDYRYKKTYDKNGTSRYKKIKDEDDILYSTDGNPRKLKGSDIPGDFVGYDVHTGILVGNKFLIRAGYANNVVRPINEREKPQLPMRNFCYNMAMGGNRCVISRLKSNQQELDRLAYKIQDITGRAYGKVYIINGNKLDVSSTELLSDLKIMGLHVSVGGSGEPDDPKENQPLVETIDMTLDPSIIRFIELRNEQKQEMDQIASMSDISQGQQPYNIGKGVQQNTIQQNSYGHAGMNYGLLRHYEQILQYNIDLQQMLWSLSDTVEEEMVIGEEGMHILNLIDLKEFGTQPMKVSIKLSDITDIKQKDRIQSVALAAAQNREITFIDYLEWIEMAKSPTAMLAGFKTSMERRERQMAEAQKIANQSNMQHDASLAEQKALNEAALLQLKENSSNWREAVKVIGKLEDSMQAIAIMLQAVPTASPLLNQMEQANAAMEQQQQQQQQPMQEQPQQQQIPQTV